MFRRIQGLQLGLKQCRNPFEPHPDLAGQHYLFLYLTGRGEYKSCTTRRAGSLMKAPRGGH
jgi:hypothetical protein